MFTIGDNLSVFLLFFKNHFYKSQYIKPSSRNFFHHIDLVVVHVFDNSKLMLIRVMAIGESYTIAANLSTIICYCNAEKSMHVLILKKNKKTYGFQLDLKSQI